MREDSTYYLVKKKALPEVLLKVVAAKKRLECDKNATIAEITETVGLSRSSFYKYKDDIFLFQDNTTGRIFTFLIEMEDIPGILSRILNIVAQSDVNLLTINQSIPMNGIAIITLSIEVLSENTDIATLFDTIENTKGILNLRILSRE